MSLTKLKDQVEYCLKMSDEAKNSDISLFISILLSFYKEYLKTSPDGQISINLAHLYKVPNQDNVKRIRANFQNKEKLYLPTDKEVAKKRGWLESEWRNLLGYY